MRRTIKISYLPHQLAVFDCPTRHIVYVKGRRAGGTHGAVSRLCELAHLHPGQRHLWIDTTQRNIAKLVARYFRPMLGDTRYRWDVRNHVLHFESGALCDFGSAERPRNLEGFAYDRVWVNEAGLVLRNEDLYYHTLLPMLLESPRSRLFCVGAPKGRGLFQRMYEWGQDKLHEDWRSFRHTSYDNPLLDAKTLEQLRLGMPERTFRQELLAEFVDEERSVFWGLERLGGVEAEAEPVAGACYVMGVDLARYTDFTVVWVGRTDPPRGVYCQRFQHQPWNLQTERIAGLARRYAAPIYLDASGVGDPICEALRTQGCSVVGVVFTAERKQQLIEHLVLGIAQEQFDCYPHEDTLRELAAFEQQPLPTGRYRLQAPAGQHDDCVIALALCYWGLCAGGQGFILGSGMESAHVW